jgi:preprotein translocase SecE subunit
VARNRQRAKQRQQQRREERLRAQQEDGGDGRPGTEGGRPEAKDSPEVGRLAGEIGAPPENLGRADAEPAGEPGTGEPESRVVPPRGGPDRARDLTPEEEDELFLEEEDFEVDQEVLEEAEAEYAPRGRRGGEAVATTGPRDKRGDRAPAAGEPTHATGLARVVAFLRACWAELQRVQWPDRKQTTQLTAIVLVFIILMGGYLGLLDAIVSRVVQEII